MKSYLIFSKIDRYINYPSRSIKREKQLLNKRISRCYMAFADGFIIDYNHTGLHTGYQDYPIMNSYWIPGIQEEDELEYTYLIGKEYTSVERDTLLSDINRFQDYPGESELDIVSQIKNEEVLSLKTLKRLTHSSLIAYIYKQPDFWMWDADRVYHELGERPLPGTITDFIIEK